MIISGCDDDGTLGFPNWQYNLRLAVRMQKSMADRYGARIIGSEVVGLTPAKALLDCAEFYLKLENYDCRKQVMEYHLIGME